MSSNIGGDATMFGGGEASPPVSPSMEGVLPIRGVDGSTGEAIPIASTPGLREAEDPYRADVVRWAAMGVPSIMVEEDLTKLREAYRIPADIELILPDPNERACFSRRGCTALHLNAFVSGMRLPLHPMLRRILRAYDLAPTQVAPNGWSQIVGGMYQWFRHSFGMKMPLQVFQTIYQPRKLPRKKGGEEEVGWYYFSPWGSHKPLVTGCPSSIKQWKESWFWVSSNWQRVFDDPEPDLDVPSVYGIASPLPRCELSQGAVDILKSIYQADQKSRSYGLILNRHRCLVELGLVASKAEMDQGKCPTADARSSVEVEAEDVGARLYRGQVPLSRKRKAKSTETGTSQPRGSTVDVDTVCGVPPLQRTLAVNPSGEVVLEGPSRPTLKPREVEMGVPSIRRGTSGKLIGAPGVRISDDVLRNVPFYPSMGAQGREEVLYSQVERVLFSRGVGGRAGSQPGFGDKSLGDADEGPG
ncbi:Plus3 domain-containing protein [Abeliophyllum distichum]|uniref:Plus3 domain-containing protein n=1 Tax=Abeliophyllum distichum TaxID=126358 RepID=A0ABD1QE36_9LAMI